MAAVTCTDRQLTQRFLLFIIGYFCLHILLRVIISDSLDFDEAEQALLSQWLRPGYTEQPPLYTWIQYYLFEIFGKGVFAVSLLKNCLLCLTYICLFFSARILLKDSRIAVLAALSMLFIPQIAWESQRDMTHTTLAVCAASATLLQCLRMINKSSFRDFILLGILLSTGILAKANFALYITILFCTLLTFVDGRKVFLSRKILFSLVIIALLTGPYFHWMYTNQDIVFSATHKFNRAADHYYLKGTLSLLVNSLLFLTPLWLIYLLIFPSGFTAASVAEKNFAQVFSTRYLLICFLILFAIVILFKVTYVKDRWLQPLLFATPLFFFSRLTPEQISAKQVKNFFIIICVSVIFLYSAFAIRVLGASYFGEASRFDRFCRMNYPFTEMAQDIRKAGFNEGLIISNSRFMAGNMHLLFPESAAIIPDYRFEELVKERNFNMAMLVWKGDYYIKAPKSLVSFMKDTYNVEIRRYPIKYYHHNYKYARKGEKVMLAAIYIPLPKAL